MSLTTHGLRRACHNPAMLWDVFCRVIDNFGDVGVCWRLACDLGQRGQQVRLWIDDASALSWMAPHIRWTESDSTWGLAGAQGQPGVTVHRWHDAERPASANPGLNAGDVVVEAFGCDPPDAFIERMQARAAQGQTAQWVNLEYLSAEDYVERSHGLRSPVWSGMGAGLSKRFFYPGFTPATGGLLREPDLIALRRAETGTQALKDAFLRRIGVDLGHEPGYQCPQGENSGTILLFCYDSAPVSDLLDRLATSAPQARVLITPGHATRLASDWARAHPDATLRLHQLSALPQDDFDRLLWCCDLNLVRGEDSAVRALWAGRPHIWHIYEQDDGVHAGKLDAFMARWMGDWPTELSASVHAWWMAWNRLGAMPEKLPDWRQADDSWRLNSENARDRLAQQQDLTSQLLTFVASSG